MKFLLAVACSAVACYWIPRTDTATINDIVWCNDSNQYYVTLEKNNHFIKYCVNMKCNAVVNNETFRVVNDKNVDKVKSGGLLKIKYHGLNFPIFGLLRQLDSVSVL